MDTEALFLFVVSSGPGEFASLGLLKIADEMKAAKFEVFISSAPGQSVPFVRNQDFVNDFKVTTESIGLCLAEAPNLKPCLLVFVGPDTITEANIPALSVSLNAALTAFPGLRAILCLYGSLEDTEKAKAGLPPWFTGLWEAVILTPGRNMEARNESLLAWLRALLFRPIVPVPDFEAIPVFSAGAGAVLLVSNGVPGMFTSEEGAA